MDLAIKCARHSTIVGLKELWLLQCARQSVIHVTTVCHFNSALKKRQCTHTHTLTGRMRSLGIQQPGETQVTTTLVSESLQSSSKTCYLAENRGADDVMLTALLTIVYAHQHFIKTLFFHFRYLTFNYIEEDVNSVKSVSRDANHKVYILRAHRHTRLRVIS
ncbi:hypothetical protein B5X24_HaOG206134 [Helicoverpa armigera]|uniref:Uncharacterized protein n=1 Tax=Helicoverpa armigera TaxID=29058 RepID=A0A2W1BP51_HELAM|nr:hypothetical protein B5X24_HaOG206134 [Helicoverpa armigera]